MSDTIWLQLQQHHTMVRIGYIGMQLTMLLLLLRWVKSMHSRESASNRTKLILLALLAAIASAFCAAIIQYAEVTFKYQAIRDGRFDDATGGFGSIFLVVLTNSFVAGWGALFLSSLYKAFVQRRSDVDIDQQRIISPNEQ